MIMTRRALASASLALFLQAPLGAQEAAVPLTAQQQFDRVASWEGRWSVAEAPALQIVFESTARGSTVVERWETGGRLHSMTVYHMDGEALVATHYCPQGNQPRLEARASADGAVRFAFRDVTGLDEGESHTHALWFTPGPADTLVRSEIYTGPEGLAAPTSYTLARITPAG